MSSCPRCGAGLAESARFCSRCGEQLDGQAAAQQIPPSPPAAIRSAGAAEAGRSCPYCRFAIKPGGAMRVCEACGASHHLDCWTDNGGCAVLGCAAGPRERPSRSTDAAGRDAGGGAPAERDAGSRRRPRSVSLGAAALAVGVVALAGIAATVLAGGSSGRHSNSTGHLHTRGAGRAAARSGGAPRAPASHDGRESSAGAAQAAAPQGTPAPALTRYQRRTFSVDVPSGWVQEENELAKPAEVENTWHQPGGGESSVLIDVHAPTHLTPQQDAEPVHRTLEEAAGYRQIYYGEGDLSSHTAWMWIFENEGSERIDYFFETCSNVIAVLGAASPESFGTLRGTFREVAQSVRSDCE